MPDDAVVAQAEELLAGGVARVPAAERRRRLVRKHDEVLAVVEHCLGAVLLQRGRAGLRCQVFIARAICDGDL